MISKNGYVLLCTKFNSFKYRVNGYIRYIQYVQIFKLLNNYKRYNLEMLTDDNIDVCLQTIQKSWRIIIYRF